MKDSEVANMIDNQMISKSTDDIRSQEETKETKKQMNTNEVKYLLVFERLTF